MAPELQDWGPSRPGLSKAGLLQGHSKNPTGLFPRLPPGTWGLVFQGPSPRQVLAGLRLPAHEGVAQGPTGMPQGFRSASFGGNGKGARTECGSSRGAAGAAGTGSPARPGASPPALRVSGVLQSRGLLGVASPPRTHRTSGSLTAAVTRVLARGRGEGGQGASWGLQGRREGVQEGQALPLLGLLLPFSSHLQHVGRCRLNVHSERWGLVSQLRAVGTELQPRRQSQ